MSIRIRRGLKVNTPLLLGLCCVSSATALEPQPITFFAADGVRIAADYYPPPSDCREDAPIAILLHAHRGDRKTWQPVVAPLHEAGFAVLAPDLRGHGASASTETRERAIRLEPRLFRDMQADLRGAYDWLAKQPRVDRARFALVGAGTGVGVALQYAAKDRSVDTVVGLSPGLNDAGLDSAGDMGQITGRRILLMANAHDRDAPYTLKKRGDGGVRTRIYSGTNACGTDLLGNVPGIEREIVAFLVDGVGKSTTNTVYGTINSNIYHAPDSGWLARIAPTNLRYYSSTAEAEARGLRPSRSGGPPRSRGAARDRGHRP